MHEPVRAVEGRVPALRINFCTILIHILHDRMEKSIPGKGVDFPC